MPVQIITDTTKKRQVTLQAGSAPRKAGQAIQSTPPALGGATWTGKAPTAAGKGDGVLYQPPAGFNELTDSNGTGYYLPIHSGGEQRLNAGAAVAVGKVVRTDADGNWIEAAAGVAGPFVALEAAAAKDASFGARPALPGEVN